MKATPLPLLVFSHPLGADITELASTIDFQKFADETGAVFLVPQVLNEQNS